MAGFLAAAAALPLAVSLGPSGTTTPVGYDISYPQCRQGFPVGQSFAVVGVNGGHASSANPCLARELAWAAASPGLSSRAQPAVSFYVNTGDPGPGAVGWPASGTASGYGRCPGTWSRACAYLYGRIRAEHSYGLAEAAARRDVELGLPSTVPASDPW